MNTEIALENWAKDFFARVDAQDAEGLRPFFADDLTFTMGNMPALKGVEATLDAFKATDQRFRRITHEIVGVLIGEWDEDPVVSVTAKVRYEWADDREAYLPVTSTLRLSGDDKINTYAIFLDPTPLMDA